MEKKQFLWDFCSYSRVNSELFTTKRDEKHQKVFFYTNLVPKARLMENLDLFYAHKKAVNLKCSN